jgi:hypothetical protein
MKLTRLWVTGLVVLTCISLASAQNPIRLRFEVYRNGTLVGNPEVSVTSGSAATLAMEGVGRIAFTPTSRDSGSVSIEFAIVSGGRHLHPVLVLQGNSPASASWSSTDGKESFKFTVARVR